MELFELLSRLTAAPSVSGCEEGALAAVNACAGETGLVFSRVPGLGNLRAAAGAPGKCAVTLLAHADKTGLIVTAIDEKTGFLRVSDVGGFDPRTAPSTRVTVYGERPLPGVIISTPPHLAKGEDAKKALPANRLTVDIGLPYEEAARLVRPGDRIQLRYPLRRLAGDRAAGPYLDNCAGMAAVLLAAAMLKEKDVSYEAVFTSMEEVGSRGAAGAAFAAEGICVLAVDATFAAYPGVKETVSAPLGSGVRVGASPILDRALSDRLRALAAERKIPFTVEVMGRRTGTDADPAGVAAEGRRTGLVSIPVRNMHTPAEVADLGDIRHAAALIAAFIETAGTGEEGTV
jgi:endoglucanase